MANKKKHSILLADTIYYVHTFITLNRIIGSVEYITKKEKKKRVDMLHVCEFVSVIK